MTGIGLAALGMLMSHRRPRVSNDNPYSEALFRTFKYCPAWPTKGFTSLVAVREWMLTFEHGYNPTLGGYRIGIAQSWQAAGNRAQ